MAREMADADEVEGEGDGDREAALRLTAEKRRKTKGLLPSQHSSRVGSGDTDLPSVVGHSGGESKLMYGRVGRQPHGFIRGRSGTPHQDSRLSALWEAGGRMSMVSTRHSTET